MRKHLHVLALILILVFFANITAFANNNSNAFDYGISMSSSKWNDADYPTKIELCKISDETLAEMSTTALVKSVIDYPFLVDLTLFNSFEEGYKHVLNCSSALQELVTRDDGFIRLIDYYDAMPVGNDLEPLQIIRLLFVEILISNYPQTVTYTPDQLQHIEEVLLCKQSDKSQFPEVFGNTDGLFLSTSTQSQNNAEFTYHTVSTLKNVSVSVIHYLTDLTTAQKNAENIAYSQAYPNATILGTATKNYNCASYAMINRSTSNIYWLNNLSPTSAGYTFLGSTSSYAAAGRVIYYTRTDSLGSHVGVVQRVNNGTIWIRSKMGYGPLAEHKLQDCAYYLGNVGLRYYN